MTAPPPIPRKPPIIPQAVRRGPPLDLQLLADLPSLALRSRCFVDGFLNGRHRSPQKGSSVEFAEYRDYQFGDDLRRVDWRLFARSDRLHVRQYEDEAQMRVFTVLDASASMDFNSRRGALNKLDFARLALAGIATLAQRQGDAFGLAIAGAELVDFLSGSFDVVALANIHRQIGKLPTAKPDRPRARPRSGRGNNSLAFARRGRQ